MKKKLGEALVFKDVRRTVKTELMGISQNVLDKKGG
jgi:hypothetical protein